MRDLTVSRGGLSVLKGISFDVIAGQALILRGPNGIGKTTLLRTLAGLQDPVTGQITCAPDYIAYASHADGIKAALTVSENLQFWAQIYGTAMTSAAFDLFDLGDLSDRIAGTLSAGQKRRLGLGRLAVINRKVLLLDEPTVSLDGFSVKMFTQFLTDHHLAQGGVAVIATHVPLEIQARTLELTPFAANSQFSGTDEAFL